MIEYFSKKKGVIERISEYSNGCWINVINPSDEEIQELVEKFGLNKDTINQGLDIYEEPRFEVENNKIYIFLAVPTENILDESMSSFLIIYTKSNIITVSKYNLEIFGRFIVTRNLRTFNSEKNLLRILFFVSKSFENSVHNIVKEVKKNKTVITKLKEKNIEKLIKYEDILNNYITPLEEIVQNYNRISKTKLIMLHEKDKGKLDDLIIALDETLTLSKMSLKTITNMRDYYSTKISTDLNKTVTLLTVFTIFLTIPTLIASIYGMNINLPFQHSLNIIQILAVIVIVSWALMFSILKLLKIV